jgi:hypothetical protein
VAVLAITFVPAIIPVLIKGRLRGEEENWIVRSFINIYKPVLQWLMKVPAAGIWFLAFLFWFFAKRLNSARLFATIFALCVLQIATPYLVGLVQMSQEIQTRGMKSYAEGAADSHSEDSLGMRFVVNQPLPIRLVLGSIALMVNPIPLWNNFNDNSLDYHWIKGYHGIYQVIVLPLFFAGCLSIIRMFRRYRNLSVTLLFLVGYLLINLAAVVATSLEQRHIAQFMPAFMILAALPDTREKRAREELRIITMWWLAAVILVHLAWAIMKGIV